MAAKASTNSRRFMITPFSMHHAQRRLAQGDRVVEIRGIACAGARAEDLEADRRPRRQGGYELPAWQAARTRQGPALQRFLHDGLGGEIGRDARRHVAEL